MWWKETSGKVTILHYNQEKLSNQSVYSGLPGRYDGKVQSSLEKSALTSGFKPQESEQESI